ncbi:unnamed protein product [Closterium sp. Naga37s-1]|nr:unnamed protein product [Closterium sp. Naga37s-1]
MGRNAITPRSSPAVTVAFAVAAALLIACSAPRPAAAQADGECWPGNVPCPGGTGCVRADKLRGAVRATNAVLESAYCDRNNDCTDASTGTPAVIYHLSSPPTLSPHSSHLPPDVVPRGLPVPPDVVPRGLPVPAVAEILGAAILHALNGSDEEPEQCYPIYKDLQKDLCAAKGLVSQSLLPGDQVVFCQVVAARWLLPGGCCQVVAARAVVSATEEPEQCYPIYKDLHKDLCAAKGLLPHGSDEEPEQCYPYYKDLRKDLCAAKGLVSQSLLPGDQVVFCQVVAARWLLPGGCCQVVAARAVVSATEEPEQCYPIYKDLRKDLCAAKGLVSLPFRQVLPLLPSVPVVRCPNDPGYCISPQEVCDSIQQCSDGWDELDCFDHTCQAGQIHCPITGYCAKGRLCDGNPDCWGEMGEEDENPDFCQGYACPAGWKKCADGLQCVEASRWCDGAVNCLDGSDEGAVCVVPTPLPPPPPATGGSGTSSGGASGGVSGASNSSSAPVVLSKEEIAKLKKLAQEKKAAAVAAKKQKMEAKRVAEEEKTKQRAAKNAAIEAKIRAKEEKKAAVAAKKTAVEAKKKQQADKEAAIAEKKRKQAEKAAAIEAEKKKEAEKKAAIEAKKKQQAEKEAAIAEKKRKQAEKAAAIEAKKKKQAEKAAAIAAKNKATTK